ncbi:Alpha/beta hydrolase fold-1 [Mycena latifolia]|nr:Alpha/beta hydrolase fold-1 [Mycena latifolia]
MHSSKKLFSFRTSRNFHCIATKWDLRRNNASPTGVTMVLLSGIGLTSDVWTPVVERLHKIQTQLNGGPFLDSIWAIDRPSHGDSGVRNEALLAECPELSPAVEYAAAFAAFLSSPLLSSSERANLIVVAHSAGISALQCQCRVYAPSACQIESRVRSLVLIEPTIFDYCDGRIFEQWIRRVEKFLQNQRNTWTTIDQAMASNKSWQKFHPEVRAIIANTFFRRTGMPGGLTTKTLPSQEISAFKEVTLTVEMGRWLSARIPKVPTYLMYGSRRDYWPKVLDEAFFRFIEKHRHILAGVTPIVGGGHFAPQEAPDEIATSIYEAVAATAAFDRSKMPRL